MRRAPRGNGSGSSRGAPPAASSSGSNGAGRPALRATSAARSRPRGRGSPRGKCGRRAARSRTASRLRTRSPPARDRPGSGPLPAGHSGDRDERRGARGGRTRTIDPDLLPDRAETPRCGATLLRARFPMLRKEGALPGNGRLPLRAAGESGRTARSSNAEPLRQRRPGLAEQHRRRLTRVEDADARPISLRDAQVSAPDILVKPDLRLLEPADRAAPAAVRAREPFARVEVVQKGEIRHDADAREGVDLPDEAAVEPPAHLLVSLRGVGKAVAENEEPGGESRADHLEDVLTAIGFEEEPLRHRIELLAPFRQKQPAEDPTDSRTARLARGENRAASAAEAGSGELDLGRFAGALDPFERDERHGPSKNKRGGPGPPGSSANIAVF